MHLTKIPNFKILKLQDAMDYPRTADEGFQRPRAREKKPHIVLHFYMHTRTTKPPLPNLSESKFRHEDSKKKQPQ